MTDAAKASVWDAVWQPWGGVHSITGTASLDARLPGQWFQAETGLHYNWHRQYDPTVGRYTQPDPLGFVDGPSVYGYARGRPATSVDRDGRFIRWDLWGQGAGGATDMVRNYYDMRDANWRDSDKYFHCKANCEAARRGRGGRMAACMLSDGREWFDQVVKGDSAADSAEDQIANRFGRDGAQQCCLPCTNVCEVFRPLKLPPKY
jgi:RHS repeat-associated protein